MLETGKENYKNFTASLFVTIMTFLAIVKIYLSYAFAFRSEQVELAIIATIAIIGALGVVAIFDYLSLSLRLYWFAFVGLILISYVQHFSGLEYICNTISFLGIITMLPYVRVNSIYIRFLYLAMAIFSIIIILFASKFKEADGEQHMTFNTNTSGFVLFVFEFMTIAIALSYKKGVVKRYIFYLIFLVAVIFQIQFAGRSSLLGTGMLLIYFMFRVSFNKITNSQLKYLVIFICFFAIIFAYLYAIVLFGLVGHGNWFIAGKDVFTGRQIIWQDAFEQLKGNWLFGIGNTLASMSINGDTSGVTNLHNQMMGYLTCFGILVAIAFSLLLSKLMTRINKLPKYVVAFILILLIMSYFDTVIYSTDNIVFLLVEIVILNNFKRRYGKCKR